MKIFSNVLSTALLCICILPVCMSAESRIASSRCKTKYPVVLVHGLAFRDKVGLLEYWGDIPDRLREHGARVFLGEHDAFTSHERNAKALKSRIMSILKETGSGKVNIIAHSKGGIESRYLISRLRMADKIASLTTVATPHRGSTLADIVMKRSPKIKKMTKVIDLYARILGDKNPDTLRAGRGLTRAYMRKFNKEIVDMPGVYYQSFTGVIDESYPNPIWRVMHSLMYKDEGDNDGMVSVESSKWGNFRGIVKSNGKPLVSHTDIIGMHILSGVYDFDADKFYISVVSELKEMGY